MTEPQVNDIIRVRWQYTNGKLVERDIHVHSVETLSGGRGFYVSYCPVDGSFPFGACKLLSPDGLQQTQAQHPGYDQTWSVIGSIIPFPQPRWTPHPGNPSYDLMC